MREVFRQLRWVGAIFSKRGGISVSDIGRIAAGVCRRLTAMAYAASSANNVGVDE